MDILCFDNDIDQIKTDVHIYSNSKLLLNDALAVQYDPQEQWLLEVHL